MWVEIINVKHILMKEQYIRNLVNLWKDQDTKVSKIAKEKRVPKTQIIRELIEIGLKTKLTDLK